MDYCYLRNLCVKRSVSREAYSRIAAELAKPGVKEKTTSVCQLLQPLPPRPDEKDSKTILKALVPLIECGVPETERCATYALGRVPKPADFDLSNAIPILLRRLEKENFEARWSASVTLTKLRDYRDTIVPKLIALLSSDKEPTRHAAAHTLHDLGERSKELVPVYSQMLFLPEKKYGSMSLLGANGLLQMGAGATQAIPKLAEVLTHAEVYYGTRARAARALGVIDPTSMVAARALSSAYPNETNPWVACEMEAAMSKLRVNLPHLKNQLQSARRNPKACVSKK